MTSCVSVGGVRIHGDCVCVGGGGGDYPAKGTNERVITSTLDAF